MSPQVPVKRVSPLMVYWVPSASQLSSTNHRLCASQNALTADKSNGLPSVWAIMTAFVLGERAASSLVTSMLYWGTVTSTNTGTAPYWMAGVTVVGKPQATVMISSPFLIWRSPSSGAVSAMKAIRLAEEPLLTRWANLTPIHLANSFSNWSAKRPVVSQKSSVASVRAHISFSSKTRAA